ncbi:MAG TPA: phosphotransferase [Candidatus Binatia bacterium]|nr:phosphotransferase [Candidatus Binatia bacterium]
MPIAARDPAALGDRFAVWLAAKTGGRDVVVGPPRRPSAGVSNETLLVDATWTAGGGAVREALVVRLTPSGAPVFPEYDLPKQFRILERLAGTDVPVPPALWYEADPAVLGAPFYVMRRVEGAIPSEIPPYHAFGLCLDVPPPRRARLWWSGIETLARIHALDWRARGLEFLGVPGPGTDALDRQLDYWARFLDWGRGEKPQPILDAALAWLREHRYAPARTALCWGDSRLPNLIFRGEEVVAVLDWEMAFLGDPEADLAWWLFLDWCSSTGYGIPRLEGFPTPAETVARYEALAGHPVEHLRWQEVMAAFRYGVITVKIARNMAEAGVGIAAAEMETNNVCTQRLAELLGLPPPGAARAVTHVERVRACVQFHLTGEGGADWYVVAEHGQGTRHPGVVADPDVTVTATAADWDAIQTGRLNRIEAFLGGRLAVTGEVTLLMQLEDLIAKLGR